MMMVLGYNLINVSVTVVMTQKGIDQSVQSLTPLIPLETRETDTEGMGLEMRVFPSY